MQLPIDDRILEILRSKLVLSPTIIAENIGKSREEVGRRLAILTDKGLVDRVRRGRYSLTDDGEAYLAGELDASDLDESRHEFTDGEGEDIPDEEILAALRRSLRVSASPMVSAGEVGSYLPLPPTVTERRLHELRDEGEVEGRQYGKTWAWWLPTEEDDVGDREET